MKKPTLAERFAININNDKEKNKTFKQPFWPPLKKICRISFA